MTSCSREARSSPFPRKADARSPGWPQVAGPGWRTLPLGATLALPNGTWTVAEINGAGPGRWSARFRQIGCDREDVGQPTEAEGQAPDFAALEAEQKLDREQADASASRRRMPAASWAVDGATAGPGQGAGSGARA